MVNQTRKLAAIVFTDIVGFTKLSSENEPAALELLAKQRELLQPIVDSHNGEWLKEIGDGLLLSFSGNLDAVTCAIEIQETVQSIKNLDLRIGIHQGEVIFQDNDVLGDDVNIASRIEPFSASGGIAISDRVNSSLERNPDFETRYLGKPELQGVSQNIKVYCVTSHGLPQTDLTKVKAKLEPDKVKGFQWNRLSILGVAASVLGVITLGLMGLSGLAANEDEVPSIAILYMNNLGSPDDEPWAYGLTEDLILEMSNKGSIRVPSMQTILTFKDDDLSETQVSENLKVRYLLSSSIHKMGEKFNLRCQLQDTRKGVALFGRKWTEDIESSSLIVSSLADSILKNILNEKEKINSLASTEYKADPVAYEYYLKAKYKYEHKQSAEDVSMAEDLYKQAITIDPNLCKARSRLGWIYFQSGKIEMMKANAIELISISTNINDPMELGEGYNHLGIFYAVNDKHDSALVYFNKYKDLSIRHDHKKNLRSAYNNLSILNNVLGNRDAAHDLMLKAMEIVREVDDGSKVVFQISNLAASYINRAELEQAFELITEGFELLEDEEDLDPVYRMHGQLSRYYFEMGLIDSVMHHSTKSLKIAEQLGLDNLILSSYINMMDMSIVAEDYSNAKLYLDKAERLAQKSNRGLIGNLKQMAGFYYDEIGEYEKAYESYKSYQEFLNDSSPCTERMKAFGLTAYCALKTGLPHADDLEKLMLELKKNDPIDDFTVAYRIFVLFKELDDKENAEKYLQMCYDKMIENSLKINNRKLRKQVLNHHFWYARVKKAWNDIDPA